MPLDVDRDHVAAEEQVQAADAALVEDDLHQVVVAVGGDVEGLLVLGHGHPVHGLGVGPHPGQGEGLAAQLADGPHHVLCVVAEPDPLQIILVYLLVVPLHGILIFNRHFSVANEAMLLTGKSHISEKLIVLCQ